MSRQLLIDLNGSKNGLFKKFIDNFEGEPRIAWYPSAGNDYRALLYLHPSYTQLNPVIVKEPKSPDIFLFTDYQYELNRYLSGDNLIINDPNTSIMINHIEELPSMNLTLNKEIVNNDSLMPTTNKVFFLEVHIESKTLGTIKYPVIYAIAENETFYCNKLIPNNSKISHIIHIRYGGGCGGGGKATGIWLKNVLKKLNCEVFITDGTQHWRSGDKFALTLCKSIPKKSDAILKKIRELESIKWSGHGDVQWFLIN
jgi:hypothetical protein